MRTVGVVVRGRVQGVGYRAFVEMEAVARGLSGWVRNRRDGTVEAVLSGASTDVEEVLATLRRGPRSAVVTEVETFDHTEPVGADFEVRPTV
jgi:acylphosphatase